jgi:hypothetical protein
MHDASKMLQIYACHSHASLLSKEDKTTPKAWRRRHQWITWRRVVAAEWFQASKLFQASNCKTLILLRRRANADREKQRFLMPRCAHLHCVERVRVVHRELVVAGLAELQKGGRGLHLARDACNAAHHLQQNLLDVVFVAHLKILDAGNRDAPLEIQAVPADTAVNGNNQTRAIFVSKDGASEAREAGWGVQARTLQGRRSTLAAC